MPLLNGKVCWTALLATALLVSCASGSAPEDTGGAPVVHVPPAPAITVARTLSADVAGNLASVPSLIGASYAWTVTNGTITAGAGTTVITFTSGDVGPLTLACAVTNAAGSAQGTATVNVVADSGQPVPPAIQAPPTLVLGQGAETVQTQPQPNCAYNWTITGGTIVAGQGTPVVTFDLTPSASGQLRADGAVGRAGANSATLQVTVTDKGTGNSTSSSVTVPETTVTNVPPSNLVYAANPVVFTVGQPALDTQTSAGGSVTSYALSGTLPPGLTFDAATGFIGGTPTALAATTSCVVTASNAAGSTSAKVSITVENQAPAGLSYGPNPLTFTVGQAGQYAPTSTGGTPTSYALSNGTLPAGLTLDGNSGVLGGTPTAATTGTVCTVTASNGTGSTTATLTLVVASAQVTVPAISAFTAAMPTITAGSSTTLTGIFTGGTGSVNGSVGAVTSGVAVTVTPAATTTYTLTVTNASGTALSATTTVTVVAAPATPVITAPSSVNASQAGYQASIAPQADCTYAWTITGGTLTAGANAPAVTFTAGTGPSLTLSCVVTNAALTASHAGTATATIVAAPTTPVISAPASVTTSQAGYQASIAPQPGCTYAWTISGGTLTTGATTTDVTFTAGTGSSLTLSCTVTNPAGSATGTSTLSIQIPAPSGLSYPVTNLVGTVGTPIAPDVPTVTGSGITFSVTPSLPAGLALDPATGIISGTPTAVTTSIACHLTASNLGGAASVSLLIGVVQAQAPMGLAYQGGASSFTFNARTPIVPVVPTLQAGSPPFTYSATGLPPGLAVDPSTGTLFGIPADINTVPNNVPAQVTVTVSNGISPSTSTSFAISVTGPVPSIAYPSATLNFPVGVTTSFTPSLSGPPVAGLSGWSLSGGAVPAWLQFSTATGTLSGTPGTGDVTANGPLAFTVQATGSFGAGSTAVAITVSPAHSAIAYGDGTSVFTCTVGQPITTWVPTTLGSAVVSGWTAPANPALPPGLAFNTGDGSISGTPTTVTSLLQGQPPPVYTVTATANGLPVTATLSIQVIAPATAPSISYSAPGVLIFPQGQPITPQTTVSMGSGTTYQVVPDLPQGLSLGATGVLSGTPAVATGGVLPYTVTATDANNCTSVFPLYLEVLAVTNGVAGTYYFQFPPNGAIALSAANATGGAVTYAAANLPSYLTLDTNTGLISGTAPGNPQAGPADFTVTATDEGNQTGTATIQLVVGYPPTLFSYGNQQIQIGFGTALGSGLVPAVTPSVLGGPATSWSATNIPSGLAFDTTSGAYTQGPTYANGTPYGGVVTANGATASVNMIEVSGGDSRNLAYAANPIVLTVGQAFLLNPSARSGDDLAFSLTGLNTNLPAGVTLNPSTGVLYGTPTTPVDQKSYDVSYAAYGNFAASAAFTTISLQVVGPPTPPPPPTNLVYDPNPIVFPIGSLGSVTGPSVAPILTPSSAQVSYSLTGNLPPGMQFNTGTGAFSGSLPAGATPFSTTVTVTATNAGGSASCPVTLIGSDLAPAVSYGSSSFTLAVGSPFSVTPTNGGGPVGSWSLGVAGGLNIPLWMGTGFNSATGQLSGTPTAPMAATAFTVYTYAGAVPGVGPVTGSTTFTITVVDLAPAFSYPSSTLVFTQGVAATFPPTLTGGAVASWSISPALPLGLALDGSGNLAGTGTAVSGPALYTVTATNGNGASTSLPLSIAVLAPPPPVLDYPIFSYPITLDATLNIPVTFTPTSTGAAVATWAVTSGSLPPGMSLQGNGAISGTPTGAGASSFTITGTSAAGQSSSVSLAMRVTTAAPILSYGIDNNLIFPLGKATTFMPVNQGGPVTSWSVTGGTLPTGITLDAGSGALSSTAVAPATQVPSPTVAITATGPNGAASLNVTLAVQSLPPDISYGNGTLSFPQGATCAFTPTNHGSNDCTWSISPAIPAGYNYAFNTATGVFQGVYNYTFTSNNQSTTFPLQSPTTYTVTATNALGSALTQVTLIQGGNGSPSITYGNSALLFPLSVPTSYAPTNNGGPLGSGSWSAALPTGDFSIDPATGIISGTLTAALAPTSCAVSFNGAQVTTVTLQAPAAAPAVSYGSGSLAFTWGAPNAFVPVNTGGGVLAWSLSGTLPGGIIFDPTDGSFSGTGTTSGLTSGPATCVVTAANDQGSTDVEVTVSVVAGQPDFAYLLGNAPNTSFFFQNGVPVGSSGYPLVPTALGEPAVAWSVDQLPPGVTLDPSTGTLGGTPTDYYPVATSNLTAVFLDGTSVTHPITFAAQPTGNLLPAVTALAVTIPPSNASTTAATVVLDQANPSPAVNVSVTASGYGPLTITLFNNLADNAPVPSAPQTVQGSGAGTLTATFPLTFSLTSGPAQYYALVQDAYGDSAYSATWDASGINIVGGASATVVEALAPVPSSKTLTFTNNRLTGSPVLTMTLSAIPSGFFTQGSSNDTSAQPPFLAAITEPFYMMSTQLTYGLWGAIENSDYTLNDGLQETPITTSNMNDVLTYAPFYDVYTLPFLQNLNTLNGMSDNTVAGLSALLASLPQFNATSPYYGWTWRLPTEAEWEMACRAGVATDIAWSSTPQVNAWGLDMQSAQADFVQDWFVASYPGSGQPQTDPLGPAGTDLAMNSDPTNIPNNHVVRGGPSSASPNWVSSYRYSLPSPSLPDLNVPPSYTYRDTHVGFRLVLAPPRALPLAQ